VPGYGFLETVFLYHIKREIKSFVTGIPGLTSGAGGDLRGAKMRLDRIRAFPYHGTWRKEHFILFSATTWPGVPGARKG
jgi:hypothetical protein